MTALKTRPPTGAVPWPLVLVEGGENLSDLPARFWKKIDFNGPLVLDTQCWEFIGANSGGKKPYGVTWDGQRRVKAHRFTWEAANGAIPDGLVLDHLCKVTRCVRPSHLEPVTNTENILRGDAPGPLAIRTNRCKYQHEYTPENTFIRPDGFRECRICRRASRRETKRRQRARRMGAAA